MKIGVFDSGLGGLLVLKNVREVIPEYDYVFFGDQAFVPYGNKTKEELYERAKIIFTYLFEKHSCKVILLACNTTSTNIYNELKEWVKENFPDREIWGIVKPTVEAVRAKEDIVFFGTHLTVSSHAYKKEMEKLGRENIIEIQMPELCTMIENDIPTFEYIKSFNHLNDNLDYTGVLVCTHYGIAREDFKKTYPQIKNWIVQEDIVQESIQNYLREKISLEKSLSCGQILQIFVSNESPVFKNFTQKWFPNQAVQFIEKL